MAEVKKILTNIGDPNIKAHLGGSVVYSHKISASNIKKIISNTKPYSIYF